MTVLENKEHLPFVIIGAGAAGIFCAINLAANTKSKVIVYEKTNKILSKVKVSGGGRCNVTHACYDILQMSKNYPRGEMFVRKAFHNFFTTDMINWLKERNVLLHTESDGRMFPTTNNSQTVIDCLLHEAKKYSVEILTSNAIVNIKKVTEHWQLKTEKGDLINAKAICLAVGGYHKLQQFEWLNILQHSIIPPVPSLFTFNIPNNEITKLMGLSHNPVEVTLKNADMKNLGPLLITHWGMSGPAILKLSSIAARWINENNYEFTIYIKWLQNNNYDTVFKIFQGIRDLKPTQKLKTNLFELPTRLWSYLLEKSNINSETNWASLSAKSQKVLIKNCIQDEYIVNGKTTFKEEFVSSGGIDTSEVLPHTMESKLHKGLFFAGEALNVDGVTGGFNFQHAWTSGYIAAKSMATL